MAKKIGAGVGSAVGAQFTRNGQPVNPVHAHPEGGRGRRRTGSGAGKNYGVGEWVALGAAGAITGIVGLGVVGALREGFGGGVSKFGPKGK